MGNTRKAKPSALSVASVIARAEALDARRRQQIKNQVASIDRLLGDRDAAAEIARLHERIAELEAAAAERPQ